VRQGNAEDETMKTEKTFYINLKQSEIDLIKTTFALVNTIGDLTARFFYERLFELSPETQLLFTGDMQNQRGKFMATLNFIVQTLDQPQTLQATTRRLGHDHARYQVTDEHYRLVGDALLWSLEKALGPAYTPDVHSAWEKLYTLLSSLMKEGAGQDISE
jgi:hemoglobin-like flavoprotein